MTGLRLYKKEKLCSPAAIEMLFSRAADASSSLSYPLRAVWRSNEQRRSDAKIAFLVSVPKKRLRHAVDRVLMRRRIREAYRLARPRYALPDGVRLDVAFLFVADRTVSYASVSRAMDVLMEKIAASCVTQKIKADESV